MAVNYNVPSIGWRGVVMARSGSQSLRATQLGSRLIRKNINQWYSICADLVNTRKRRTSQEFSRARLKAAAFGDRGLACHIAHSNLGLCSPKIKMDLPNPVNAVFQADAFRVRRVEALGKPGGLPLFKPSLKIQRDDPHNQNSAVTVAPVSTVLHARVA